MRNGGPKVGVVIGSSSDLEKIAPVLDTLKEFGVSFEIAVISAHRSPEKLVRYAQCLPDRGIEVVVAAAGLSAALPGALAALVDVPVIGLPVAAGPLNGVDALLSIVQMPPGVPVAGVGIGAARNAALMAVRIIASHDESLRKKLAALRESMASSIDTQNRAVKEKGLTTWQDPGECIRE